MRFFDTTLRDGEQTPGISITPEKKIQIARALDQLGVEVIEAGFAAVSPGEFEAVKLVSAEGLDDRSRDAPAVAPCHPGQPVLY